MKTSSLLQSLLPIELSVTSKLMCEKTVQHRPQLDTLRCLAILLVFYSHSVGDVFHRADPWGTIGVKLFFVISGFLITRIILLNVCKTFLKAFYIRRLLRIFPLYYLVLAILLCIGKLPYPEWCFSYLYNIRCVLPNYLSSNTDHFWSLAVEEQFYLIFPALILACARSKRAVAISSLIGACVVCRILAQTYLQNSYAERLLPICGEFLLWGSLAGYIDVNSKRNFDGTKLLAFGVAACSLVVLLRNVGEQFHIVIQTLTGISLALVIFGTWRIKNPLLLKFFTLKPIVYLGKISYGFYIIHFFCFDLQRAIYSAVPPLDVIPPVPFSLFLAVVLASFSWHVFESPINNLKSKFPYAPRVSKSAAADSNFAVGGDVDVAADSDSDSAACAAKPEFVGTSSI
jgi:peptidoglycan/LPS O-acetylase OafA/YrhL